MNTLRLTPISTKHQSGAALVVALILLVALSLMAISSMNTASLDLVMAGNEQYRSRAFAAAETGIERALVGGTYNSTADFTQVATAIGGSFTAYNTYAYVITRPNNGIVEAPPPGNSEGKFGAIHFQIEATGVSDRNSTATNTQGLFQVVQDMNEEETYNDDACAGKNTLDSSSAGC